MEQTNREPISVEVKHWCEKIGGEVRNLTVKVGRDRQSAINAWNTRAARPTWTDERPTVPGWYWWRRDRDRFPVATLLEIHNGVLMEWSNDRGKYYDLANGQWAQIELPQEEP